MSGETITIVCTITTAVGSGIGWLVEYIKRKREESEKMKAQGELENVRRRGEAPFFAPSDTVFDRLHELNPNGEPSFWMAHFPNVLCYTKGEVEKDKLAKGDPVILVTDNLGQAARRVLVKLDNETISVRQEPHFSDASGLQYFTYPYDPEKHGMVQKLSLSFESLNGFQDTHVYRTRHGFRELVRTDPM